MPLLLKALILAGLSPIAAFGQEQPHFYDVELATTALLDGSPGVLFDSPSEDTVWARGADYKAKFDETGATFVPFLGSDAPRNYPLGLRVDTVAVGGCELPFYRQAPPHRVESTVTLDRGSFHEIYDLEVDSIRQSFLFAELPEPGDLVIRIALDTELIATSGTGGITFEGTRGGVHYGRAVAFGARGEVAASPVRLIDGRLEIRVDEKFLARAASPILVDPLITTVSIDSSTEADRYPDIAYDASLDRYVVCWQRKFSGSDNDIYGMVLDANSTALHPFLIDTTELGWLRPKIAGIDAIDQFLIVSRETSVSQCRAPDLRRIVMI